MKTFERAGANLRIEAYPNGGARCAIAAFLIEPDGSAQLCGTDAINLSRASDRRRWVESLPENLRAEADPLAQELGILIERWRADGGDGKERGENKAAPVAPWDSAVDGAALFAELERLLLTYVVLAPAARTAVILWLLHTYLVDVSEYTPYLHVTSPVRGCGKTTLLQMFEHTAARARRSDGITAAALYRTIDRHEPTMLLDELDTRLRGDSGEMLRGVLNSGFQRGGKVTICVGDEHDVRDHNVFCAKVLSGIGRLWDTVESRSIRIAMERASRDDLRSLRKVRGDRIGAICEPFRRKMLRWADDARDQLRELDIEPPDALGARQCDVWRPLLAIASVAGGDWPDRAQRAALTLHGVAEEEGDYGLLMLQDVRDLFHSRHVVQTATGGDVLPTATILEQLSQRDDRPWPEYRKDKAISARSVASLLGRFGIKPKTVRISNAEQGTLKGYVYSECLPSFQRYLALETEQAPIPSELSVTSVTGAAADSVTLVTDKKKGMGAEEPYELDERTGLADA